MRQSFGWLLFFTLHSVAIAQHPRIDSLLKNVATCQRTYSDSLYSAGLFPSQRIYFKKKNYCREDDNIFFTGLIVWALRSQRAKLSDANKLLIDSICAKAVRNYPFYRNKHGDCTYNFWQPKPSRHFPNDKYLSNRKKHALPDDLDDTSVLYLSDTHTDSLVKKLKAKMAVHANGNIRWIHNTFRKYKHRKAYNTWFGKRMRVDFDLGVQCNAMCFVLTNKLELNQYDSATIGLIQEMVLAGEHIRYAHYVSPHYQKTAIVLYHLARLVSAHPSVFPLIKERLVQDLKHQLAIAEMPMEKLLLTTSLARFGIQQNESLWLGKKDFDGFYFFVANMTSVAPNPFKRWLARSRWTNFYYRSDGYYWSLLLENECLKLP